MSSKSKLNIDALIFSAHDVLVDVSRSYREVVCKTVQLYLEHAIGLSPSPEPLLMPAEVTLLQKVGNFTNYLDLATAFIIYFIEMLPPVPTPTFPSKYHVPALIAYLQLAGGRLHISIDSLREQKDIERLALDIAAAGGGLDGADTALPKANRHLLVVGGAITKANLLGRIFQELYLGADLFEQVYGQPTVVVQTSGYIERESLLINPHVLALLSDKLPLGVVANCSRVEVEHSLKAGNIEPYFQAVISLDEVDKARAKPIPDSWPLLEAARFLRPTPARTAYVGANPGDIQAAKAAKRTVPFIAVGCLAGAHDREALRQEFENLKADIILGHPDHLKELILG
jgi:phosphoglycolate phosphatase-like HAD superfamily hydrolase